MTTPEIRELNINTDFLFNFYLTTTNLSTGVLGAATGLTGVVGRFAATRTGAAIGSCSVALSEAGTTGRYLGVLDTATMVAALTAYVGKVVYAVVSKSGDIDCEVQAYRVKLSHVMGT